MIWRSQPRRNRKKILSCKSLLPLISLQYAWNALKWIWYLVNEPWINPSKDLPWLMMFLKKQNQTSHFYVFKFFHCVHVSCCIEKVLTILLPDIKLLFKCLLIISIEMNTNLCKENIVKPSKSIKSRSCQLYAYAYNNLSYYCNNSYSLLIKILLKYK